MKKTMATVGALLSGALMAVPAFAQSGNPGSVTPPPPIMVQTEIPPAVPTPSDSSTMPPAAPVPVPERVLIATTGQWVYTAAGGYLWVPSNATGYLVGGVPATYLYTEELGWTWYTSPWGIGPFKLGSWVARPWSSGFRAWAPGPDGGTWHTAPYGHPAGGRVYGAPGHYFAAGGAAFGGDHHAGGGGSHHGSARGGGGHTEARGAHR